MRMTVSRWLTAALLLWVISGSALASTLVSFSEQGDDVIATLSGTLDLGQSYLFSFSGSGGSGGDAIHSLNGLLNADSATVGHVAYRYAVEGPVSWGAGPLRAATSSSFNTDFTLLARDQRMDVEFFADPLPIILMGTMTFAGQTFTSLGLVLGSYVYTFANGETFTVQVVPIPAGLTLLAAGIAFLGLLGWRKRRAPVAA